MANLLGKLGRLFGGESAAKAALRKAKADHLRKLTQARREAIKSGSDMTTVLPGGEEVKTLGGQISGEKPRPPKTNAERASDLEEREQRLALRLSTLKEEQARAVESDGERSYRLSELIGKVSKKRIGVRRQIAEARATPDALQAAVAKRRAAREAKSGADAEMFAQTTERTPQPLGAFASEFQRRVEESITPRIGEGGQTTFDPDEIGKAARAIYENLGIRKSHASRVAGRVARIGHLIASRYHRLEPESVAKRLDTSGLKSRTGLTATRYFPADVDRQMDALKWNLGLSADATVDEVAERIAANKLHSTEGAYGGRQPKTGPRGQLLGGLRDASDTARIARRRSGLPDLEELPDVSKGADSGTPEGVFDPNAEVFSTRERVEGRNPLEYQTRGYRPEDEDVRRQIIEEEFAKRGLRLLPGRKRPDLSEVVADVAVIPSLNPRARSRYPHPRALSLEELRAEAFAAAERRLRIPQRLRDVESGKAWESMPGRIVTDARGKPIPRATGAAAPVGKVGSGTFEELSESHLRALDPKDQAHLERIVMLRRSSPAVLKAAYDRQIDLLTGTRHSADWAYRRQKPGVVDTIRSMLEQRRSGVRAQGSAQKAARALEEARKARAADPNSVSDAQLEVLENNAARAQYLAKRAPSGKLPKIREMIGAVAGAARSSAREALGLNGPTAVLKPRMRESVKVRDTFGNTTDAVVLRKYGTGQSQNSFDDQRVFLPVRDKDGGQAFIEYTIDDSGQTRSTGQQVKARTINDLLADGYSVYQGQKFGFRPSRYVDPATISQVFREFFSRGQGGGGNIQDVADALDSLDAIYDKSPDDYLKAVRVIGEHKLPGKMAGADAESTGLRWIEIARKTISKFETGAVDPSAGRPALDATPGRRANAAAAASPAANKTTSYERKLSELNKRLDKGLIDDAEYENEFVDLRKQHGLDYSFDERASEEARQALDAAGQELRFAKGTEREPAAERAWRQASAAYATLQSPYAHNRSRLASDWAQRWRDSVLGGVGSGLNDRLSSATMTADVMGMFEGLQRIAHEATKHSALKQTADELFDRVSAAPDADRPALAQEAIATLTDLVDEAELDKAESVRHFNRNRAFFSTPVGREARTKYREEIKRMKRLVKAGKRTPEEAPEELKGRKRELLARAVLRHEQAASRSSDANITPEDLERRFYSKNATPPADQVESAAAALVRSASRNPSILDLDVNRRFIDANRDAFRDALAYGFTNEGRETLNKAFGLGGVTLDDAGPKSTRFDYLMDPANDAELQAGLDRIGADYARAVEYSRKHVSRGDLERAERLGLEREAELARSLNGRRPSPMAPGSGNTAPASNFAENVAVEPETLLEQRSGGAGSRLPRTDAEREQANLNATAALRALANPNSAATINADRIRLAASGVAAEIKQEAIDRAVKRLRDAQRNNASPEELDALGKAVEAAQDMTLTAPLLYKTLDSRPVASRVTSAAVDSATEVIDEADKAVDAATAALAAARPVRDKAGRVIKEGAGPDEIARLEAAQKEALSARDAEARKYGVDFRGAARQQAAPISARENVARRVEQMLAKKGATSRITDPSEGINALLSMRTSGAVRAMDPSAGDLPDTPEKALARSAGIAEMLGLTPQADARKARFMAEDSQAYFLRRLVQKLGLDPKNRVDVFRVLHSALRGQVDPSNVRFSDEELGHLAALMQDHLVDAELTGAKTVGNASVTAGALPKNAGTSALDPFYESLQKLTPESIEAMTPGQALNALAGVRGQLGSLKKQRAFGGDLPHRRSEHERRLTTPSVIDRLRALLTGNLDEAMPQDLNAGLASDVETGQRIYGGRQPDIERPVTPQELDELIARLEDREAQLVARSPQMQEAAVRGRNTRPEDLLNTPAETAYNLSDAASERMAARARRPREEGPPSTAQHYPLTSGEPDRFKSFADYLAPPAGTSVVALTEDQARALHRAAVLGDVYGARGLGGPGASPMALGPSQVRYQFGRSRRGEPQGVSFSVSRRYANANDQAQRIAPMVEAQGLLVEGGRVPFTHNVVAHFDPATGQFSGFYRLPPYDVLGAFPDSAPNLRLGGVASTATETPFGFSTAHHQRIRPGEQPPKGAYIQLPNARLDHPSVGAIEARRRFPGDDEIISDDFSDFGQLPDSSPQVSADLTDEQRSAVMGALGVADAAPSEAGRVVPGGNIASEGSDLTPEQRQGVMEVLGTPATGKQDPTPPSILQRVQAAAGKVPLKRTMAAGGLGYVGLQASAPLLKQAVIASALGMVDGGAEGAELPGEDTNTLPGAILPSSLAASRRSAVLNRVRSARPSRYMTVQNPLPY